MAQKLEILKTNNHKYHQIENKINELIKSGARIISINPIATSSSKGKFGNYTSETEILVFVLYTEKEGDKSEE